MINCPRLAAATVERVGAVSVSPQMNAYRLFCPAFHAANSNFVALPETSGLKISMKVAQFWVTFTTLFMNGVGVAPAAPCDRTAFVASVMRRDAAKLPVANPMVEPAPVIPEVMKNEPEVESKVTTTNAGVAIMASAAAVCEMLT